MNIERLKLIRNSLDKFPNDIAFNLSCWNEDIRDVYDDEDPLLLDDSNYDRGDEFDINECLSVCCAIGWACQDPEVIKLGLTLNDEDTPQYKLDGGWYAVASFLNGDIKDVGLLFDSFEYPNQDRTMLSEVKARIDEKIKELEA